MAATADSSPMCNLSILDCLRLDSIGQMSDNWIEFCSTADAILRGEAYDSSHANSFSSQVRSLYGQGLKSLVVEHFLSSMEEVFQKNGACGFWEHFNVYVDYPYSELADMDRQKLQDEIHRALEEILDVKQYQEKCLLMLLHGLEMCGEVTSKEKTYSDSQLNYLFSKYHLAVSSVLMASLPRHFSGYSKGDRLMDDNPFLIIYHISHAKMLVCIIKYADILHWYFKGRLEELSAMVAAGSENDELQVDDAMDLDNKTEEMDVGGTSDSITILGNSKLVRKIGVVVRDLRSLGFSSIAEEAYASAIFSLLKAKVHELAGDKFKFSSLKSIKRWIQDVPLQFLHAILAYHGDSNRHASSSSSAKLPLASHPCDLTGTTSEGLVWWQLRLEYFAYETLQDLRISKLFEIIVDYPDSSPAIEDLKQCLEYTGQHSKLVDSFIDALKYRLLTAGASTNDILLQYVSTIKAFRTIDPAGIFLESVGEPLREYLRGRKDTIKCIVTMLTDGNDGNAGDSLLEELNKDEESQENPAIDDDVNVDDKRAWINEQNLDPDPVEADPLKGGRHRRKISILGMIVGIIGSKDQLVNEYRVMLADKLLNKSDYDIDSEIHTLELLKIHFGESFMQKCEIMLNDLIDSKRTNAHVKATIKQPPQQGAQEHELSLDTFNATIISSNFWPPIQDETLNIPGPVDQLLSDYAKRFHEIKTPRKLRWKKNLGTVKLELQFEDRMMQFTVTPLQASIICQFEDQKIWTSNDLAAAVGVPADILKIRIYYWINKGVVAESVQDSGDHIFSLVETCADSGKNGLDGGSFEELETSVASVEDQLHTVYENFITGMLTNNGSMALDGIQNSLKISIGDPSYNKSIQQLQSFLSGLVAEEKLEFRDGMYSLKKKENGLPKT